MKLYLHIGHGKTGSSYLQSWLACNAEALLFQAGLIYPEGLPGQGQAMDGRALRGHFSQGNGFVFEHLLQLRASPEQQRRWRRRLVAAAHDSVPMPNGLVFSFEGWTKRFAAFLPDLQALMACWRLEQVELLLLVRDPLEHACSVYSQVVKRHGYGGSLDDWLASYRFTERLLESLDAIAAAGSSLQLTVAHYGRQRGELLPLLQGWLNLDPTQPWQQPPQSRVNRSLTLEELRLMRYLNRRIGDAAARVGEHLVDRLPGEAAALLQPSQQAVDAFQERLQEPVELVNQRLPAAAQLSLEVPSWMSIGSSPPTEGEHWDEIRLSSAQLECLVDALWQPHLSDASGSDPSAAPG